MLSYFVLLTFYCSLFWLLTDQFPQKISKTRLQAKQCNPNSNIICSNKCVPLSQVCDQVKDCADGTDEINCDKMEVSLKGGTRRGEGRVEIRISNITGSICGDQWDDRDAMVLCRMLGYSDVTQSKAVKSSRERFGTGTGVIWTNEVDCNGDEDDVIKCSSSIWGEHDCTHQQDVGVVCIPEPETLSKIQTCGRRFIPPYTLKIIGGRAPAYGSQPWLARVIALVSRTEATHVCGGTIIGERWVVTSAHCLKKEYLNRLAVKVADHSSSRRDSHEQFFHVENVFIHPDYSNHSHSRTTESLTSNTLSGGNENFISDEMASKLNALRTSRHKLGDIALLKLRRPSKSFKQSAHPKNSKKSSCIQFNDFVQPACLPDSSTTYEPDMTCVMAGWGRKERAFQTKPDILQTVNLPIMSDEKCQQSYPSLNKYFLTKDSFCAGYNDVEVGGCYGDSGGPFVCLINGSYTLMGTASKTRANSPNIFLRMSSFVDWIQETMETYD